MRLTRPDPAIACWVWVPSCFCLLVCLVYQSPILNWYCSSRCESISWYLWQVLSEMLCCKSLTQYMMNQFCKYPFSICYLADMANTLLIHVQHVTPVGHPYTDDNHHFPHTTWSLPASTHKNSTQAGLPVQLYQLAHTVFDICVNVNAETGHPWWLWRIPTWSSSSLWTCVCKVSCFLYLKHNLCVTACHALL